MNKNNMRKAWPPARPAGLVAGALLLGAVYSPASAQQLLASARIQQSPPAATSPVAIETVSLKQLLKQWESEYHATILYESEVVGNKRVPLQTGVATLEARLSDVLAPADLTFKKLRDNYFIVTESPKSLVNGAVSTVKVAPQDITVSGRVTQSNGEGLPGVTVLVKGTSTGISTDADGRFTLSVPENSTLVFTSIGFVSKEVAVSGPTVDVVLAADSKALNEIVVVGYGTQERQSVTGAVASVSGRDIAAQPVADPAQAIQGRAAGVQVVSNSGAPGGQGGTSIRVRGITSAGNNSPLYVVDGFPLPAAVDANGNATGTELNSINPNDIETIDVLKDASATAIYGLRAANGVVLITTKRGKAGTANISIDSYVGVQNVWRKVGLLNAQQFAELNNEAINNFNAQFPNDPRALNPRFDSPAKIAALPSTNYLDEIFRQAKIQNYSISATGGGEKARYAVSAGYFQQDGTIIGSSSQRFTLRTNGEVQLNKILKAGSTLALTHQEENPLANDNNEISGPIQLALQAPPFLPAYNPDGSFYEYGSNPDGNDRFGEENPLTAALRPINKNNRNRATTTFYAELEPLVGLRLRSSIGADLQFNQNDQFFGSIAGSSKYNIQGATANSNSNYQPSYLIENTATYDRLFAADHHVTFLLGQSAQQFDNFYLGGSRVGYTNNALRILDQGPVNAQTTNYGGNTRTRLLSYFGRLNYEFAGKYLFQAIARFDGSSAFGRKNSIGFFPGVSAGWRLSEESFLKDVAAVSNLKLRVGYGRVGNPLNAGTFAYTSLINSSLSSYAGPGTGYVFGTGSQTTAQGSVPTRLANPDIAWENNEQYNVGVDLGLFQNRVSASLDLYSRTSPNLLLFVPPTFISGTREPVPTNAASSRNRGVDLSVTTNNIVSADNGFTWSTTLNITAYRSEIVELGIGKPFNGQNIRGNQNLVRYDVGQPLGSFYGYVAEGIIQSADELAALNAKSPTKFYQSSGTAPGDIKFKDVDGNGVVNDDDRDFIGNPNPDFTYGLNNTFGFMGFDLNVFLQGSQGNDVYNLNRYYLEGGLAAATNAGTIALERWTPTNTNTDVPRAVFTDPNQNNRVSSHYVENGSYLRIKLLTLGYTLPAGLLSTLHSQRIRVYASAQNLATFTKYTGFDPELGNQGNSLGVDRGIYPQSRVFLAGVNIGF